jgi:hypothetical protein
MSHVRMVRTHQRCACEASAPSVTRADSDTMRYTRRVMSPAPARHGLWTLARHEHRLTCYAIAHSSGAQLQFFRDAQWSYSRPFATWADALTAADRARQRYAAQGWAASSEFAGSHATPATDLRITRNIRSPR